MIISFTTKLRPTHGCTSFQLNRYFCNMENDQIQAKETKNPFPYSTAVLTCLKAVFKSFEASFQFY